MHDFSRSTISSPTIFPFTKPIHPAFQGGVEWKHRTENLIWRHHRGGRPVCTPELDSRPPIHSDQEYIFGGPYMAEFGHFISESIHRLGPSREVFGNIPIIFSGPQAPSQSNSPALPSHVTDILKFMGIDKTEIVIATYPMRVRYAHTCAQGSDLGSGSKEWYLDWLDEFTRNRIKELGITPITLDKIYVSRSNFLEGGFLGERFFEKFLADRGFLIFRPEDYSFASQLRTYMGADVIIIGEGSACHGLELIGKGLKNVFYFNRRHKSKSKIFTCILTPRANKFHSYGDNFFLGTIPVAERPSFDNKGITLLNWHGMIDAVNYLGENIIFSKADAIQYLEVAKQDFNKYVGIRKSLVRAKEFLPEQEKFIGEVSRRLEQAATTILSM